MKVMNTLIWWHSSHVSLRYTTAYTCPLTILGMTMVSRCTIHLPIDHSMCCAAILLHDMHNITVKRISITVQTPRVSGIILMNVSGIAAQLNTTCFLTGHKTVGIVIYEATSFGLYSSNASNCSYGLVLQNTTTTAINNVTAMYNEFDGIFISMTTNTHINNITAVHNGRSGMYLSTMNGTYITNINASHNGLDGMDLKHMNITHINNAIFVHNHLRGLVLHTMSNTHITNATISHNNYSGMASSRMNNTYMTNMAIEKNTQFGMGLKSMNNTHITNTSVTRNHDYGILLEEMENTHITKTTATRNALHVLENDMGQIVTYYTTTLISDTSFTDTHSPSMFSTTDPKNLPTVILLYHSTLHISGCNFTGNSISAVRAHSSNVTVSGTVTFSNNTAFAGPAFVLSDGSILISEKNSHTYFLNNHASNIGGVFYITNNYVQYNFSEFKRNTCFLKIDGTSIQTRFTFVNNSAGKGGDILYGGKILFGLEETTHLNCLESLHRVSNILQNGLSLISSEPLRACLCNESGHPDCLLLDDPKPHSIYPGQTINISAVVVGQNFGTVAGSVYAQFLQRGSPPQLESG